MVRILSSQNRVTVPLSIRIAQKPYIIGSLGPKALKYESFDAKGTGRCVPGSPNRAVLEALQVHDEGIPNPTWTPKNLPFLGYPLMISLYTSVKRVGYLGVKVNPYSTLQGPGHQ